MVRTTIQLFCFPYAGGSAAIFRRWHGLLPAWIEVQPVELPGHGRRFVEPLATSVAEIVDGVLPALRRQVRGPFALFGHSLGALVAFEVAHRLHQEQAHSPVLLFGSGTHAPSQWARAYDPEIETDDGLRETLRTLDGTPTCVLASPELMELALPILRADFQAGQAYRCSASRRVGCPIHAIGGAEDDTDEASLAAWRDHTTSDFAMSIVPGGHFFIHDQEVALLRLVERALSARLARGDERWPGDLPVEARSVTSASGA